MDFLGGVPHFLRLTEQVAGFVQKRFAGGGEMHALGCAALAKAHPKGLFELFYLHAQCRRGDVQALRRTAKVQLFGESHKVAQ